MNSILAVLIVGVIATLAVSFALSLLLDPSGTMNRKYFDDAKVKRSVFSSFDDACLKNKTFASKIYVAEYRIFGNTFGNRVIGGKNGFLFMAGKKVFLKRKQLVNINRNNVTPTRNHVKKITLVIGSRTVFSGCIIIRNHPLFSLLPENTYLPLSELK